ncbi:Gfo/Idh/MocA family protein [Phytoactinopolyspora endophytica]|uniref:Gfo/Idh/MocA family protein n=1 Tax=Phytoactinopolyspora endophytica TaxID=1642495 RepID=UPI00101B7141|nr:Gfo/Idh/MocA family oxidoreductase [Phytoactinopolyspora endophytica]
MIRLAIAGMAHPHVLYLFNELPRQPDVRLVAVSEPDAALRDAYTDHAAGRPVYADHREMLSDHQVDVVAVNGAYADRADVILDALTAGAQVIADKPICTSLDQLATIEATASRTGNIVSAMFEKRGYPVTLAARRLLADGLLGDLSLLASTGPHQLRHRKRPPWFFGKDYGGILGDLAVHDADMVLALTGATGGHVVGSTGKRAYPEYPQFHDHGAMLLVAGDTTATIDAHWLAPEAARGNGGYEMRIVGTRGTAQLRWTEARLDVATHGRDAWQETLPPGRRPAEDFFTALLSGRAPEVSTTETITASRIALLAQHSADNGGTVEHWSQTHSG